jgi:hypothetical protein
MGRIGDLRVIANTVELLCFNPDSGGRQGLTSLVCLIPQPARTESVLARIGQDNPELPCGSRAIKNRDFIAFSHFYE